MLATGGGTSLVGGTSVALGGGLDPAHRVMDTERAWEVADRYNAALPGGTPPASDDELPLPDGEGSADGAETLDGDPPADG